jgi:hypothetical protein
MSNDRSLTDGVPAIGHRTKLWGDAVFLPIDVTISLVQRLMTNL